MKITTKQYAQTLFELTQNKSDGEVDSVVKKFAELLKKNRQLKALPGVIGKFLDIYNKENGIIEADIAVINKLNEQQIESIENFLKKRYSAKKVVLKIKVDKNIKGGIIIKVDDEVLDGSVSRQLQELKKAMIK